MIQGNRNPKKTPLQPAPDGVLLDFVTPDAYVAGTLSVWRNGMKLDPDQDNGFLETGGTGVRFKAAPLPGDTLWGEYDPA